MNEISRVSEEATSCALGGSANDDIASSQFLFDGSVNRSTAIPHMSETTANEPQCILELIASAFAASVQNDQNGE